MPLRHTTTSDCVTSALGSYCCFWHSATTTSRLVHSDAYAAAHPTPPAPKYRPHKPRRISWRSPVAIIIMAGLQGHWYIGTTGHFNITAAASSTPGNDPSLKSVNFNNGHFSSSPTIIRLRADIRPCWPCDKVFQWSNNNVTTRIIPAFRECAASVVLEAPVGCSQESRTCEHWTCLSMCLSLACRRVAQVAPGSCDIACVTPPIISSYKWETVASRNAVVKWRLAAGSSKYFDCDGNRCLFNEGLINICVDYVSTRTD